MAMTAGQDIPQELHTKICKKIAQLTKVIYTLNAKAEEHDSIIEHLNEEHEREIQHIMYESKMKIEKFKSDCKYAMEKEKELHNLQTMLREVQKENEHLQKSLREYLTNTELNEKQLRNGYENKFLDLQNKFLERKRDYSELLESSNKYQQAVQEEKQKEIIELNLKHEDDVNNLKLVFERDFNTLKSSSSQSEKILNEKIESLQNQISMDNKRYESEYELKITKLKHFYEEELKLCNSKTNEAYKEEWCSEKAKMIAEFQLKEGELNSRIRYLESKVDNKKSSIEEVEMKMKSLQSEFDISLESITCLENTLKEKDEVISNLKDDIKTIQGKQRLIEDKFHASCLRNENYKQIEEAYGQVSRSLDEYKNKLTSLKVEYTQLEEAQYQLESKLHLAESDNAKLRLVCAKETNEKTLEIKTSKVLDEKMKEKTALIKLLEEKNADLESQYKLKKEEYMLLQQKLAEVEATFFKENTNVKEAHRNEMKKQKELYDKNIREVQKDSFKLIEEEKKRFHQEKEKAKEKHENVIRSKDDAIKAVKDELGEYKDSLEIARRKLEESAEENRLLNNGLQDNGKMMADKVEQYKKKISDMMVDFKTEKDKMILEFERVKMQIKDEHNEKVSKMEKKWQQKLIAFADENELYLKQKEVSAESQLSKIQSKHNSELHNLKVTKDGEILALKKAIEEFKSSIAKLMNKSNILDQKHESIVTEKVEQFKVEKQQLIQLHNNEITELKLAMACEMEDKIKALEIEQNHSLEALKCNHEAALLEIRQEQLNIAKALRSQFAKENEESVGMIRTQLSHEKEQMQEILRVQTEERINAITRDLEGQLEESKKALEQSFNLRQREFLVHSRKISELTNDLEEGNDHVASLNEKIAEDKAKYLNNELTTKGEEILEIRRESNSRLRSEMDKLENAHRKEMESTRNEYLNARSQDYREWENTKQELGDQVSTLKLLLEEVEEKFRKRPSREEDIEKLNDLTQKLFEREIECQRVSEERKHYRLELVNREENFNKVFNTSPNVGYINPIELSKRKSSQKR